MKINKLYIALGLMIAFVLFYDFAAHAGESNESTKVTFSAPIQIPGQVLPAGTYLFQQADDNSDLNLVQIFNADRTVLYATLQTVSTERIGADRRDHDHAGRARGRESGCTREVVLSRQYHWARVRLPQAASGGNCSRKATDVRG